MNLSKSYQKCKMHLETEILQRQCAFFQVLHSLWKFSNQLFALNSIQTLPSNTIKLFNSAVNFDR